MNKLHCKMHKVENISWKGGFRGVLTDHVKVPMEFDFCIQNNKKNIEMISYVASFSIMECWQGRAIS